jgi:hypothetical protein
MHENARDRSRRVRAGFEKRTERALKGFATADDPQRADKTPLDRQPGALVDNVVRQAAGREDAFVTPPKPIDHGGPPNDPNAPSGSLSSDDVKAIAVDFGVAKPPDHKT